MVRANRATVEREMHARGWGERQLIGAMDVAPNTVRAVLKGDPISDATQQALWRAFEGKVAVSDLFEIVVGKETQEAIAS